ncbi:MAG: hypothetical protein ABW047_15510 [Nitrospiraceae bacterium]
MRLPFMLTVFLFLSGCMYHPIALQPSTKPLSQNGYTVLGKVHGEDCVYHLFAIIPLSGGNELHTAVEEAMKLKPYGDAMIEVTVDYYFQWWILFSRACTQVHGTAVQSK